jgi:hypothetical protein
MHQHNVWLFNMYMPVEVLMLGWASLSFIKTNIGKIWVMIFLGVNFSIWLFEIIIHSIENFASLSMICGCFLLVAVYTSILFSDIIFNNKVLVKEPVFWLSLSTILYFACDIPYMGMFHYWTPYKLTMISLYNINQILNFIRYPLVAVSFLLAAKQNKQSQTSTIAYVSK